MKKHYFFKFILLLIPVSAFLLMSSSGGRNEGRTGSPGDGGSTCASCHSGGSFGLSPTITTNIPAGGYDLNTTYNITVSGGAAPKLGFQLTAEETTSNGKVGTFTAGTGSRLTTSTNAVTHSNTSNSSWSFTWKSPSSDVGPIKFYAAVNAANGDGSTGGDEIVTTATNNFTVLGISEVNRLDFDMYPNPASEKLTIQLPSGSDNATVQFYDYVGRLALTKKISNTNNKIDVNSLSTGVYVLKVLSDNKIGSQKFIKK